MPKGSSYSTKYQFSSHFIFNHGYAFLQLVVLFSVGRDWVMDNNLCGMGPVICIFL